MDFDEAVNLDKAATFKDTLQALIGENYNKRMAEKANLMEKATLLLDLKEVQKALLEDCSGGWWRTLQAIGSLARVECDENVKKLSMSTRSFKSSAFNLWKSAINLQLSTPSFEVKLVDLTSTLSKCFSDNSRVWPLVDPSVWLDTIGLISGVFNAYSTSSIPFSSLLPIWKICISRLKKSVSDDKRSERQKLSELFEILTRGLQCTEFHLQVGSVIEEFKGIIDGYSWPGKDPAKTNFLEVMNNLCENYGFEQRDLLLTSFFPTAEKLYVHMNIFSSSLEQNQSFDLIQLDTEKRTGTFQNSFCEFLEHILMMSVPDCEVNSMNYEAVFPLAQKCLHRVVEEVAEKISKTASVFRPTAKCVLPTAKVPLIARLFVITHLKHKYSSSVIVSTEDRPRPKKRSRKSTSQLFEILLRSTALAHFQILLEILRTWKHRIDQETAESIAQALMRANRNFVREDDHLVAFLKILAELVDFETESMVLEDVFNWALPLLQNPAAHNAVCLLVTSILAAVDKSHPLRKQYTFEVVVNNLSRLHLFQSGSLQLIQFLVANFDFDESFLFRISELKNHEGTKEWCFRSQLIFSLLSCAEPAVDLSKLLLSLMSYLPGSVCCEDNNDSNHKEGLKYGDLLAEFHCSKYISPEKKWSVEMEKKNSVQVVNYLVEVFAKAVETIFLLDTTEVEKKFQLWRTSTIMLRKLDGFCESATINGLRDLQMLLDQFVLDSNVLSGGNYKLLEAYQLLDLGRFWDAASLRIRQSVEEAAHSGLLKLYEFVVQWSKEIPDQFLEGTLKSIGVEFSAAVEDLLLTIVDNVTFFDLVFMLQRFGTKLSPSGLMRILESLMKRVEDQSLESSTENISQSQLRAFSLTNRREINEGQQALFKSLAANEILRVINCTNVRKICLHAADERWFRVSEFLVTNAPLKLLTIRFGSLYPLPCYLAHAENCFKMLNARLKPKSCEQFSYLRNCLKQPVLQNIFADVLRSLLLCFSSVSCIEFIEDFQELQLLHGDVLAYLFKVTEEQCFDAPEIDRLLSRKLSQPFLRYLLDPLEPLQFSHCPGIFCLPPKMLLNVIARDGFTSQWLALFQEGNSARILFSLREYLYDHCRSDLQKSIVPPLVLSAITLLFDNFQWNALRNDNMSSLILVDIFGLSKALFSQLIECAHVADYYLQDLYDRWFKFVSKTSEIECFRRRIHLLALQSVDPILDFRTRYPITWNFLSRAGQFRGDCSAFPDVESFDAAIDFVRMYSQGFLEGCWTDFVNFSSRFPSSSNLSEPDLMSSDFDIMMLKGYWRHIQKSISNQDLTASNLLLLSRLNFLCPWLQVEILPVLSLYPTPQIREAQEKIIFSLSSSGTLGKFVYQISRLLLFRWSVIFPPSVSSALYACSVKSVVLDDSGNSLVKDVPSVSSSYSFAGKGVQGAVVDASKFLVFLQQSNCVATFPQELQAFVTVACHFPIYAALLIPRVVKELSVNSTEKQCKVVVDELNVLISSLVAKEAEFSEVENILLMSIVSLAEIWLDAVPHLNLLSLVRCLVKAELFRNAHYFLRYYMDFFFCNLPSRVMFQFEREEETHFLETVKDAILREELLQLLVKIFVGTNDSISLMVVPLTAKINVATRIFVAESNHDWGTLGGLCSSSGNDEKMTEAFYYLGSESLKSCTLEAQYASALKLASWDQLSDTTKKLSFPKTAHTHWQSIYRVTKLFHDGKPAALEYCLADSLEKFKQTKCHFPDLRKLDQLRDFVILNRYANTQGQLVGYVGRSSLAVLSSWELARKSADQINKLPALMSIIIKRSKELRKLNSFQPALKLLDKLEKVVRSSGCSNFLPYSFVERAKVLIASKEASSSSMASYFLKRVISEFDSATPNFEACTVEDFDSLSDTNEVSLLKIKSCVLLSRIAPNDQKAMVCLKEACSQAAMFSKIYPVMCSKNYVKYAIFAEKRYRELREFSETPAFALKKEAIRQWQTEINQSNSRGTNVLKGETSRREREIECEKVDVKAVEDERNTYLRESSKFYLNALVLGSSEIGSSDAIIVHRFAALLMQNIEDEELSAFSRDYVDQIPSCVWLPIFNVLSSYLFSVEFPIAALVSKIAFNVIRDYPHHCLNDLLFYLCSSDKLSDGRKKVTLTLFKEVCESNPKLKEIIAVAKKAHDVLRDFAKTESSHFETFSEHGKQLYKISPRQKILTELSVLRSIPIPVLTQKLSKVGDYNISSLVSFESIQATFELADGLSTPKVIVVTGSDGVKYKLIFKKDDIRQDGLIQQLFLVSNLLMKQSKALGSLSKSFSPLRQYSSVYLSIFGLCIHFFADVLPLDGHNGIIEWCAGTQSLCGYLAGQDKKGGAHVKYRPKEPSVLDLRLELARLDLSRPSRCREFLALCKRISPVFRYFFYERYTQLEVFHQRIDSYTRSLAQWSAVCYVVGLGDRHLTNILIDEGGELVHIDLGQVFEYSKRMLKQPEKVPFRLTREMVDPVLLDGVHGKLRRVACETLKTMRENAQVLIGISSLILYDPISSLKSRLNQDKKMDKAQRNLFAECAISRLKEKLAGRDLTYAEMNAEEQMTRLIVDAQNPENLCQMFAGWLAFL